MEWQFVGECDKKQLEASVVIRSEKAYTRDISQLEGRCYLYSQIFLIYSGNRRSAMTGNYVPVLNWNTRGVICYSYVTVYWSQYKIRTERVENGVNENCLF